MLVQANNGVPDFKRWKIGAVTVSRITEIETFALPPEEWFPIDAELVKKHSWLCPDFADEDGRLLITVQAFVIESAGMKIMVDPCVGNHKTRQGDLWKIATVHFSNIWRWLDSHTIPLTSCSVRTSISTMSAGIRGLSTELGYRPFRRRAICLPKPNTKERVARVVQCKGDVRRFNQTDPGRRAGGFGRDKPSPQ